MAINDEAMANRREEDALFLTSREEDPLLTPKEVAKRLNTSVDWVWDHSTRKTPLLPVIRFGDGPGRGGMLRYRASKIEEFISEQERSTNTRRKNRRANGYNTVTHLFPHRNRGING